MNNVLIHFFDLRKMSMYYFYFLKKKKLLVHTKIRIIPGFVLLLAINFLV